MPTAKIGSITVLIASRGRLSELQVAVGSLYRAQPPRVPVQLVLVSSASQETTDAMDTLKAQAPPWIEVTRADAPLPGKCRALNVGLPLCKGDAIIFTDDDVSIGEHYLQQAIEGFQTTGAQGLQGQVRLALEGPRPAWFGLHCEALMASTIYLDKQPPDHLANLNSCNMAVLREVARAAGPFSEDLGPGTARFPLGDDTEWSLRLVRAGHHLVYWPAMSVEHKVPVTRATLQYLALRSYLAGIFQAAEGHGRRWALLRDSLWRILVDGGRGFLALISRRSADAAYRLMQVARHCGIVAGIAGRSKGHPLLETRNTVTTCGPG